MLPIGKVREVERLLAEGQLSQRKIARVVGVSRGVIGLIARGERPDYSARQQDQAELVPLGPIERCPGCGGRVYVPCRLCHVRKLQAAEQLRLTRLRREARRKTVQRILRAIAIAAEREAASVDEDPVELNQNACGNDSPSRVCEPREPRPQSLD